MLMRNIVALGMSVALLGFETKLFKDAIAEQFKKNPKRLSIKTWLLVDGHGLVMENWGDVEIDTLTALVRKDQCSY